MDNNGKYIYTSFDLMKMFNIKKGSWNYIKNKFDLDNYGQKIFEDSKEKFLYSDEAYNILKNYYSGQVIEELNENPKMFLLLQENNILKNSLNEYKEISSKFENMYNEEKNKNITYVEQNTELKTLNSKLLEDNENIKNELERLKNRNFFERLFNKK